MIVGAGAAVLPRRRAALAPLAADRPNPQHGGRRRHGRRDVAERPARLRARPREPAGPPGCGINVVLLLCSFTAFLVGGGVGVAAQLVRMRRAEGIERTRLQWLLLGESVLFVCTIASLVLDLPVISSTLFAVGFAALPLAVAVAVLRHGLFDVGQVISRARRLQRPVRAAADRATRWSSGCSASSPPASAGSRSPSPRWPPSPPRPAGSAPSGRSTGCSTASGATRSPSPPPGDDARLRRRARRGAAGARRRGRPGAAAARRRDRAGRSAAARRSARPATPGCSGDVDEWPLTSLGQDVGRLAVTHRHPGERWRRSERAALEDAARRAAALVWAAALTADLQASRERIVAGARGGAAAAAARPARRRRPGAGRHGAAARAAGREALARDPDAGRAWPAGCATRCAARWPPSAALVDDLRPPALDELGLVAALREHVAAYRMPVGRRRRRQVDGVTVDAEELPPLRAAVEVAAYRIATEA